MVNEAIQGFVQVPTDGSGKRLDTRGYTTAGGTFVHREVMHIGGTAIGQIAIVTGGSVQVVMPGAKTVLSATAASFLARAGVLDTSNASVNPLLYPQLPRALGQNTAASSLSVVLAPRSVAVLSPTSASFLANVTVLGTKLVRSETAASFLVTMPGAKTVLSPTAASFNVTTTEITTPSRASYISAATVVTGTGTRALIAAGGAGIRNYITSISGSNPSTATNVLVVFKDGSSGGVARARFFMAFAGGGFSHVMPIALRNAANSTFAVQTTTAVNVHVSAQGYRAA